MNAERYLALGYGTYIHTRELAILALTIGQAILATDTRVGGKQAAAPFHGEKIARITRYVCVRVCCVRGWLTGAALNLLKAGYLDIAEPIVGPTRSTSTCDHVSNLCTSRSSSPPTISTRTRA